MPGAILISIVVDDRPRGDHQRVADHPRRGLGPDDAPKWPGNPVATPDFGLIGQVSLFGGFEEAGVADRRLFVFTVLLSGFFDAMGTIIGVSDEAGLIDEQGNVPGISRVLFVDGLAVAAGGALAPPPTPCFVESTAGVGEGARTGLANVVTGALFAVALFLTPLAAMVPVAGRRARAGRSAS